MFRRISEALSLSSSRLSIRHSRARREGYSPAHFKKAKTIKHLQSAIDKEDVQHIQEILSAVDVVELEEGKLSFVRRACETGNLDAVAALLNNGASVNLIGNGNKAPVHIAAKAGDTKMLQLLLTHNANINALTKYEKRTPLHIGMHVGHQKVIAFLVRNGANINQGDIYGCRPIHIACRKGQNKVLNILFNHQVEINAYDNEGWTAMHYAAKEGHKDTVKALIEHNANIDAQSKYGRTALHWACISGHLNIIHTLLKNGTNVNIKDVHGNLAQIYVSNDSARKIMKKPKGSLRCSSLSGTSQTDATLSSSGASTRNLGDFHSVSKDCVNGRTGSRDCQSSENQTISDCFDGLVITTDECIANVDSSVEGLEALFKLTVEGSIDCIPDIIKDFNSKMAEISVDLRQLRNNFTEESEKFEELITDCKSGSNPGYITLIQIFVQCFASYTSQQTNGWQMLLENLPLQEEVKEMLLFVFQQKQIPECEKVKQVIMHWARSCDSDNVSYMWTLLHSLEKCKFGEEQNHEYQVNTVIEEFITMECNFKTGSSQNLQAKLECLAHSLPDKDIRQLYTQVQGAAEDMNIFPDLDKLQLTDGGTDVCHSKTQRPRGASVQWCDKKLEQVLTLAIEQENIPQLVAAVKCIILSGHEELLTCIL